MVGSAVLTIVASSALTKEIKHRLTKMVQNFHVRRAAKSSASGGSDLATLIGLADGLTIEPVAFVSAASVAGSIFVGPARVDGAEVGRTSEERSLSSIVAISVGDAVAVAPMA